MMIWCKTGLSNSLPVQTTFKFLSRSGSCNSVHNNSEGSTWIVNRTDHKPHTCTLYIEGIQPSDSGDYFCEVKIRSVSDPVRSGPLHVEVTSENFNFNYNELLMEITIPAGGLVLILLVVLVLVVVVYNFVARRRRHRGGGQAPEPHPGEDPRHPLVQCKVNLLRIYKV